MSANKGGRWCAAPNCSNNSHTNKELSFFRFPKDDGRAKEWVIACRREDLFNKSSAYLYENCKICSVHFEDLMYLNFLKNRLKPEAVPTLFNIPNPPKLKGIKRKAPMIRSNNLEIKTQKTAAQVCSMSNFSSSTLETISTPGCSTFLSDTGESTNLTQSKGQQTELIISSHTPRKQKLRLRVRKLQARNRMLTKKINQLKSEKKVSLEDITVDQFKTLCSKFLSEELARFIKVQIDLNNRTAKGRRYSIEFKKVALTIYFLSPKAYRFLSKIFYLPSKRSLQRLTEQWRYKPGINNELFSALKYKIDKLSDMGKSCVLCADEMSLKKFLFYSIKDDIVIGLHDTGMGVQLKPAGSALVFMIRSIYSNWKQPVGYIHRAPKLLKIQPEVFSVNLPQLKILRIVNTGLEEIPNLNNLNTDSVLHMIDLEHNNIQHILTKQVNRVKAEQLLLNYNNLQLIEEEAFHGSQIAKLSLKGNTKLKKLHRRAFAGLQSLRYIDLSKTAITLLPTEGLREIDVLKVQDTESLKAFPSVFNFQFIKEAWLTYPYHCCAFKFPYTHNPWEFERHQIFRKQLREACSAKNLTVSYMDFQQTNPSLKTILHWTAFNNSHSQNIVEEEFWNENDEVFHNNTLLVNTGFPVTTAICGEIYTNYHKVKCQPSPDAFNPCEDLMGNWILRVPVWFISLSAVVGNLFVIIVISTSRFRLTVSKFLMCNLAVADLCIGLHLFLITIVDACSIGVYFNYAIDWQEGDGCRVAGFLTIFGNVLSVYTLTIITTERWYTITWAIHLNRRLKLRTAVRVMFVGWICAIIMALLPLVGISSYSKTSICLPLEKNGKADAIYLSTLLVFNAFAFALICICYGSMYKSIRKGGNRCSTTTVRSDLTVAKRMALLVFTDFACWAPIAFFGLTALLGSPLITVTQTKILLVFFYPLNSCANPYLYALLTQQYRRDFFILMGRYGLCKDRAERHKGAIGGKPLPYGSGLQYKRPSGESQMKCHSVNINRNSVLTTFVSVDIATVRTNSRYSNKSRQGTDAKQLNNSDNFDDYNRHTTTENL